MPRRSKSPAKNRQVEKGRSRSKSKAKKSKSRSRSKPKDKSKSPSRKATKGKQKPKSKGKVAKATAQQVAERSSVHWPFTEDEMNWKLTSFRRGITLCGAYHIVMAYGATLQSGSALALTASTERTAFSVIGLILIWWTTFWGAYPMYYGAPPPKKTDRKYNFIAGSPFGFGTYLTNNILFALTAYFCCFSIAEISLCLERPVWQAVHLTMALAQPACAISIVLFLLWFKFNWLEEEWQKLEYLPFIKRGYWWFGPLQWYNHTIAMAVCVVHLLVVFPKAQKELCFPFLTSFGITSGFALNWLFIAHYNHDILGLDWPYPFFNKIFATRTGEVVFVAAILGFCGAVLKGMDYLLAYDDLRLY